MTVDVAMMNDAEITQELVERMTRGIAAMLLAFTSGAGPAAVEQASRSDAEENTDFLRLLVDLRGWPTAERFGEHGQAAAGWLLAFSARTDWGLQDRCLALIARLREHGQVDGHFYAFTVDRVLIGRGRRQRYGTQEPAVHGRVRPDAVEDPLLLNARRAQMGLEPLQIEPPRRERPQWPSARQGPRRTRRGTSRP